MGGYLSCTMCSIARVEGQWPPDATAADKPGTNDLTRMSAGDNDRHTKARDPVRKPDNC